MKYLIMTMKFLFADEHLSISFRSVVVRNTLDGGEGLCVRAAVSYPEDRPRCPPAACSRHGLNLKSDLCEWRQACCRHVGHCVGGVDGGVGMCVY